MGIVDQLQATLAHQETRLLASERKQANTEAKDKSKFKLPEVFKGECNKLRGFLTGMKVYFKFHNVTDYKDKAIIAGRNLDGEALEWFLPFLTDFMDNAKDDDRRDTTVTLFGNFATFETKIKEVYSEVDEN